MVDESHMAEAEKKLSPLQHVICGWPLVLIVVGGLIGGACGGAAYAINAKILRSSLAPGLKYLFVFLIGVSAIATYFVIALGLVLLLPDLFGE